MHDVWAHWSMSKVKFRIQMKLPVGGICTKTVRNDDRSRCLSTRVVEFWHSAQQSREENFLKAFSLVLNEMFHIELRSSCVSCQQLSSTHIHIYEFMCRNGKENGNPLWLFCSRQPIISEKRGYIVAFVLVNVYIFISLFREQTSTISIVETSWDFSCIRNAKNFKIAAFELSIHTNIYV